MRHLKIRIHAVWFALIAAVFFTAVLNIDLMRAFYNAVSQLNDVNPAFVVTMPIFTVAFLNILLVLLTIKYLEKSIFILLLLSSSIINYIAYNYGLIFRTDVIAAIFATNTSEALAYFSWSLVAWFLLTGVLPSLLVALCEIVHSRFVKDILLKAASVVVSCLVIGLIFLVFFKDYSSLVGHHATFVKRLVPTYYISTVAKYLGRTYFQEKVLRRPIGLDATQRKSERKQLSFVIVGETARSQNYQLNGYPRPTNSFSIGLDNLISLKNASSCATLTQNAVPCMFSTLTRTEYTKAKFEAQEHVVDILQHAGVKMLWIDNNDGCEGVCANIETIETSKDDLNSCDGFVCTDDILLSGLQAQIDNLGSDGGIIFLHLIGSHAAYHKRVPQSRKVFLPECPRNDVQNCTQAELVNTYDNTILFTDYVMTEMIKLLDGVSDEFDTSLLYVSDHGESLGEEGIYLHGLPYFLAPDEQKKVPFVIWMSESKMASSGVDYACLEKLGSDAKVSHDNFSHTLMGLLNIETEERDSDLDLLELCRL